MAKNIEYEPGNRRAVACSYPATPKRGDPVRYGYRTGIALTDEDSGGTTSVDFGPFDADFAVQDSGGGGITVGDLIWFHDAPQKLNNTSADGYFFGHANAAVGNGQTATISVHHEPSPGAGTIGPGTVGTTQLTDACVTKAKIAADVAGAGLAQNIDGSIEIADGGVTIPMLSDAVAARAVTAAIGAVTANAEKAVFVAPTDGTITGVQLLNRVAIAADSANYWTFQIVNKGAAGEGTDVVAAIDTKSGEGGDGESLAEFVATDLTVDEGKADFEAGDVLSFKAIKAASATALADTVIVITYAPAEAE